MNSGLPSGHNLGLMPVPGTRLRLCPRLLGSCALSAQFLCVRCASAVKISHFRCNLPLCPLCLCGENPAAVGDHSFGTLFSPARNLAPAIPLITCGRG